MRTPWLSLILAACATGSSPQRLFVDDTSGADDRGEDTARPSEDSGDPGADTDDTRGDDTSGAHSGDTDDTASDTDPPSDLPWAGGRYRITSVAIMGTGKGADLDGDGSIDNNLASLIANVDAAVGVSLGVPSGTYSLASLNASLEESLASEALVLLLAHRSGITSLAGHFDLVDGEPTPPAGFRALPGSYVSPGVARWSLGAVFVSPTEADLDAASLELPAVAVPDEPVGRVTLRQVQGQALLTSPSGLDLWIAGAVPVTSVKADVLAAAYDPDGLGLPGPADAAIDSLIALSADLTLPGGGAAVSAAFRLQAVPEAWTDPPAVP